MISQELLDILACPVCKTHLRLTEAVKLQCDNCRLAYPIRDGIPILLQEEAAGVHDHRQRSRATEVAASSRNVRASAAAKACSSSSAELAARRMRS